MKQKIYELINKIISDEEEVKLADDTSLDELGFDSLLYVNLIIMLEELFKIEFSEEDLQISNFTNIIRIMETISKYERN